MKHHNHPTKSTLALALAVLAPATTAGAATTTAPRPPAVRVISVTTHGFDWADAGIGAAGGVGVSMLVVGGGLLIAQRRERRSGRSATAIG